MKWDFTGNIARIVTKYETLESLWGRARVLTYLREALSSTPVCEANMTAVMV
jgi:hypothetical protein